MSSFSSESELLPRLVEFLARTRRINGDTIVEHEIPWFGRRIDFATMTKNYCTASYELKLKDNFKAVEQAAYNCLTFDRSYVVTATNPSDRVSEFARQVGVGLILITSDTAKVTLNPIASRVEPAIRKKLLAYFRRSARESANV